MQAGCQHHQLDREDGQLALLALARVPRNTNDVTTLHVIVQQQEAILIKLRHPAGAARQGGEGMILSNCANQNLCCAHKADEARWW